MRELGTIGAGFAASAVAGLCTGVGALPIFFRQRWGASALVFMLSIAAGVMLGATVFSLIVPALELVRADRGAVEAALTVALGVVLGAGTVWLLNEIVPHEHPVKGAEGIATGLGRHWLFVLAITLHNLPEGMSVGVAYGTGEATGLAVALGIGLQNMPEGLAVAAALAADGLGRARAFGLALLTGLVEPVGGLLGATAVGFSDALLPWGLSFAGGAMLFVISGEVIPETHRQGAEQAATFSLVLGFILMMFLDVTLG